MANPWSCYLLGGGRGVNSKTVVSLRGVKSSCIFVDLWFAGPGDLKWSRETVIFGLKNGPKSQ